jgi:penicillin-binding protein 1A
MSKSKGGGGRRRVSKNQFVTKSGKSIKLNRNMLQRLVAHRDSKEQRKAIRMAGLPKSRIKRFFYHFQPKRMYHYWFSRDGALMALKITGVSIAVGFVILIGLFAYFRKDLPNITDVSGKNIGGSVTYYDKTGQTVLWEDYDAVKRIPVKEEDIANNIKLATVAIEDKDFFKHGGFDVRGIMRAGFNDAFGSGGTQGGSTITQQLVKLTQDWTDNRTIARKVKELILSVELEREYSKTQILAGYLNVAPYGNIEYGVEAAANDYFHKSAKDLTLDEAAFLAAIPKSPSIYSPYGPYFDKEALLGRQHYILDQMVNQGMVSKAQAQEAKKIDVVAKVQPQQPKYAGIKAPYFALAAKSELEDKYGSVTVNRGGWKVITTIDMKLQALAEKAIQDDTRTIHGYGGDEAAFVAEDVKTGQVVALVGGTNFEDPDHGKINYAHEALIPPGSSFKPYDYVSLIDSKTNVGAGSVLYDTQGPLPGYPCTVKGLPPPKGQSNCLQDYDFRTPGPLTLRYALGGSRNIPAVKANLIVGTDKVIKTANALMGTEDGYNCYSDVQLTQQTQCYGASAIGDGAFLHLDDHLNGFASLARLGNTIPRTYILKITDSGGKTIQQYKQPQGKQAVRQDSAYIVDDITSDPNASYLPGGYYKFHRYKGWNFSIKTGTTNNGFDGLMASWSTQYAAVAWVGYHTRNKAMTGAMEYMTTPIIRTWMQGAHDALNMQPVNWAKPAGVKTAPAYVVRSHVGIGSVEPSPSSDLVPGWYQAPSRSSGPTTIDKVSGKAATDCTPALAKQTVGNGDSNSFSVDTFVTGASGGGTDAKDDVHVCGEAGPSISFANPPPSCTGACDFTVIVNQGAHPLNSDQYKGTLNLIIGGQTVQSQNITDPGTYTFTGVTSTGSQQVSAQVIDSVLYDATATTTTNFSGESISLSSPSGGGNNANFSWSGGNGPYTVFVTKNSSSFTTSCNDSGTSCSVTLSGNGTYQAYVRDSNSIQSNTVSFSRP